MRNLALGVLLALAPALCADWPQWRGPARDGVVTSLREPASWPERLTRKWKITVGLGHSSPIYAAGRIYVVSRQQDREVVSSVNPEDGKILGRQPYPAPYKMNPAAVKNSAGAQPPRIFAGGKIVKPPDQRSNLLTH